MTYRIAVRNDDGHYEGIEEYDTLAEALAAVPLYDAAGREWKLESIKTLDATT